MPKPLPLALALVLVAFPALAQDRMVVVEVASPPTMIGMSTQITLKIIEEATRLGHPLIPPQEVRAALGSKGVEEVQNCRGQVGCVVNRLKGFSAKKAVIGYFSRDDRHYLLKLWLIDLQDLRIVADVDRKVLIASRKLMTEVNDIVPDFLTGQRDSRGTLQLVTDLPGVDVKLAGAPIGITPLTVQLKPGKYEITLLKDGYFPVERLIGIEPNQTTVEEVTMIAVPQAPPPKTVYKRVPYFLDVPTSGWVAASVGLAAAGVGTYFGVSSFNLQRDLKAGYDPTTGQYQGTRAQALRAQEHALYANVGYGVAGAAVVTAMVLTLFNQPDDPSLQVAPAAAADGAGAMIQGAF